MSEKTVTEDPDLAALAFNRLVAAHAGEAVAAVRSRNNRQEAYVRLDQGIRSCEHCGYRGPMVDGGETCPRCLVTQCEA